MAGISAASLLRASSPEHGSFANVKCGLQTFDDDGSTAAPSTWASETPMPEMASLSLTPPSTPQPISYSDFTSPPCAPRVHVMPPLMKALRLNSAELVEEALIQEPGIAFFPFWEHDVEPPLCFAVRHRCSAAVVSLLLQHGADPQSEDIHGKCPADIVISMRGSMVSSVYYPDLRTVEQMLGVKSDVAAASHALPPHSRSEGMIGFQPSREVGVQAPWDVMDDFYTNSPNSLPWGSFRSSDLPWFSAFESNESTLHNQEAYFPWLAELDAAM